jgi:hypothetical protein
MNSFVNGKKFKINFSNKHYMSKMVFLAQSCVGQQSLVLQSLLTGQNMVGSESLNSESEVIMSSRTGNI